MKSRFRYIATAFREACGSVKVAAGLCCVLLCALVVAACSTKENNSRTRFWHSFSAKYNTMFNGGTAFREGIDAQLKGNTDNYTELLPVFVVGNEASRSLGKGNFETAIEKCEKAIQLHSIKKRPKVDVGKRKTEKMKLYLQRKEYNPYLKNAWLLMGQAQFWKGEFVEAASTFSYITRLYAAEPPVAAEARAWLARCYAELDWYYDAEDVLNRLGRDSLSTRLGKERDATMADLLLRQGRLAEAQPYLERAAKSAPRKLQKARLYFLLGQVRQQNGDLPGAYKALAKCIRQNPPYQLAFNARILQTEVMGDQGNARRMIGRLKGMARSDKNKDYLDQVYYAMGNIYLAQKDTANAISAYEKGRAKGTRSGIEKGVLLLRLGQLYWERHKYASAQTCYSEALGMIDKSYKDYAEVTKRSKVLDKLVPFTSVVELQDSLQALSLMSEADRNAAIDRVIEALKKKEREEARARADSAAAANASENGVGTGQENVTAAAAARNSQQSQVWYFYNPMLVMQGKEDFRKRWGSRKNEDDWRRSNKSVLSNGDDEEEELSDSAQAAADSLAALEQAADTVLSAENDPHQRAYYLKQIPFTEEAKAASNLLIMDGLYNAGIIEKDELEDFPLAASTLGRIVRQYPSFDRLQDTYYQLFLLYSRWGKGAEADRYRDLLATQFPDSATTKRILAPDYLLNARYGKQMEDSLYAATYNAYRNRDMAQVERNYALSTADYPDGANRPKFIFVHALSRIGAVSGRELAAELRDLVRQYPQSDVSDLAGMLVKGLEAGRQPGSGGYDLGSLWERRTAQTDSAAAAGGGAAPQLSPERDAKFVFLVAYPKDSLDDNRLLFDIAHFNFTHFYLRNFDIEKVLDYGTGLLTLSSSATSAEAATSPAGKDGKAGKAGKNATAQGAATASAAAGGKTDLAALNKAAGKQVTHADEEQAAIAKTGSQALQSLVEFRVRGFNSFDEVHAYAQDIYRDADVARQLRRARVFLISEANLQLLGRQFSFADYETFYEKTFAPMQINPDLPLDVEGEPVEQQYEEHLQPIYPLAVKGKADTLRADTLRADSLGTLPGGLPADSIAPGEDEEGEYYPIEPNVAPDNTPTTNDEEEYDIPAEPEEPANVPAETPETPVKAEEGKTETNPEASPTPEAKKEPAQPVAPAEPAQEETPQAKQEPVVTDEDGEEWYPADDETPEQTPATPAKQEETPAQPATPQGQQPVTPGAPSKEGEDKAEPKKEDAEPKKEDAESKKEEAEPKKEEAEPKKEETEPKKEEAEPKKEEAEPKKEDAEPKKEDAEPKKEDAEPKKEDAEPKKEEAEPDEEEDEDDGEWYPV